MWDPLGHTAKKFGARSESSGEPKGSGSNLKAHLLRTGDGLSGAMACAEWRQKVLLQPQDSSIIEKALDVYKSKKLFSERQLHSRLCWSTQEASCIVDMF